MQSPIQVAIIESIAIVELNRPESLNAIDQTTAEAFFSSLQSLAEMPDLRALIIKGRGRGFCAGGDVATFQGEEAPDRTDALIRTVHAGLEILVALPQPSIAALHGAVAGVGLSLALACDFAIADDTAKLTTAYSRIGATLDGAMSWSLPHTIGMRRAKELALLGDVIDAEEAWRIGIINRVVASGELDNAAMALATRLSEGPTAAYGRIKSLLNGAIQNTMSTQLDMERHSFVENMKTQDFRAGVEAFSQKERPHYKGY